MSAYAVMIRERMNDKEAFAVYQKLAAQARGATPPKALAFYGAHEVVEGPDVDGIVVLEFDTMQAAKAWYDSDAYQTAAAQRHKAADYRVMFVQGV